MREIKFRAYDEQQKIMHLDFEFISSGQEHNDWIIFKSDKQQLKDKAVFDNPYFYKQFKIMQYTGLKDKNGVEICEGDILRTKNKKVQEVIFMNGFFQMPEFFIDETDEVIGNIYEHGYLLDSNS